MDCLVLLRARVVLEREVHRLLFIPAVHRLQVTRRVPLGYVLLKALSILLSMLASLGLLELHQGSCAVRVPCVQPDLLDLGIVNHDGLRQLRVRGHLFGLILTLLHFKLLSAVNRRAHLLTAYLQIIPMSIPRLDNPDALRGDIVAHVLVVVQNRLDHVSPLRIVL